MTLALSAAELAGIDTAIERARGLPNRFYNDAPSTQFERDAVLGSTWTCIGFASDTPPSHATPVDFMGLPLLVVRDAAGDVRTFHNVCRHRGHRLVAEAGHIEGALRCPYHRWTYGLDGALRGTPHLGGHGIHEVPGFDRATRGLMEVRCAVWHDLLFVNIDGEAPPFEAFIAPLVERWTPFVGEGGLDLLSPARADERLELTMTCNWKLAVENFCESYHLPWIHPELNSYSRIEDHYNILAGDWGAGQGTRVFEFSERAGIDLPRFPAWPADQLKIAEYIALFPNVLVGLQNDHAFAIVLRPLSPSVTHETVQLYYLGGTATSDTFASARRAICEGWRSVFLEDVGVCEGMQSGRDAPAFDGGAFSPVLDNATHHFHRWVAQRLAGGADAPRAVLE